jgi:tetratricopeptide (TPR) repeat protein
VIDVGVIACPEYERLWHLAEAAKDAGQLEEARQYYAASREAALARDCAELVDRAVCNEAAVAIEIGGEEDLVPHLRAILMRHGSETNCFLASKNIARAYELRREYKKGLFYARIARDHAELLGRPQWRAAAVNQLANCLLGDSLFDEAASTYRLALSLVPAEDTIRELTYLANLGYCEVVLKRFGRGMSLLYGCLRTARRNAWSRLEMIARIDLCFAHLECDRLRDAERHGRLGLALAENSGELDWVKNALFLLGQVAVLSGASAEGQDRFEELQQRFYPTHAYLSEFLLNVDVRGMVNLRA